MTEKLVESMKLVDFSNIKLPLIVVYDHPSDYPDAYVARVWEAERNLPTNALIKKDTLQEIREDIRSAGFIHCISRAAEDHPTIVESWI